MHKCKKDFFFQNPFDFAISIQAILVSSCATVIYSSNQHVHTYIWYQRIWNRNCSMNQEIIPLMKWTQNSIQVFPRKLPLHFFYFHVWTQTDPRKKYKVSQLIEVNTDTIKIKDMNIIRVNAYYRHILSRGVPSYVIIIISIINFYHQSQQDNYLQFHQMILPVKINFSHSSFCFPTYETGIILLPFF